MKHVVFFSSGIGSWASAMRAAEKYGTEDLTLLFADTLIEDNDNYRFLIDSLASVFGWNERWFSEWFYWNAPAGIRLAYKSDWRRFVLNMPPSDYEPNPHCYPSLYPDPNSCQTRKEVLEILWMMIQDALPVKGKLIRVADGRTPFELWKDERAIASNRMPFCSAHLKQQVSRDWMCLNEPKNIADWHRLAQSQGGYGVFVYDKEARKEMRAAGSTKESERRAKACPYPKPQSDTTVHVGIGWDEMHRLQAIQDAWQPWRVECLMVEPPYLDKPQVIAWARAKGLEPPRLYNYGLPHANCGGGCVRAGHAHWKHVFNVLPEVFALWEREEIKMREYLGKDVAMLSKDVDGRAMPYPLFKLRQDVESDGQFDLFEWGGCGCFVDNNALVTADNA